MADRFYRNGRQVDAEGADLRTGGDPWAELHGASWSSLETFIESRGNYRDIHHLGTRFKKSSPAMEFGKLYHCAVLEPATFAEYVPAPDFDRRLTPGLRAIEAFNEGKRVALQPQEINRRTKDGREEFALWEREHSDCVVIKKPEDFEAATRYLEELEATRGKRVAPRADLERAEAIRDAVMVHPKAAELLSHPDGKFEAEISWIDRTGIEVFAHPDFLCPTHVIDLKGTRDPAPRPFTSDCESKGYARQGAIYLVEAWAELYGDGDRAFWHIAVRNEPPFEVACYRMDVSWINDGIRQVREALDALRVCVETDDWRNGYEKEWSVIERPAWAAARDLAFEEVA